MDSTEYTKLAIVTESRPEELNMGRNGLAGALQLLVVASQVADKLKRHLFYGPKGALNERDFRELLVSLGGKAYTLANSSVGGALVQSGDGSLHAPNLRVLHAGLGLFSESGEVLEALVGQLATGGLDLVNVGEEGGDCCWYQAVLADETGVSMAQNMETNIAKLRARYGNKFSSEAATTRDLAAERSVLEEGLTAQAANDDSAQVAKAA